MSFWVAAAAIGSAIIGAASSNEAAKKQSASTKGGLKQANQLVAQSRATAQNLYGLGMQQGREGLQGAYNFYKQNAERRYQPFIQGNVAAQQAIIQGQQNAQNAILGLPMTQLQAQQINPDLSYLSNATGLVSGVSPDQLSAMIPAVEDAKVSAQKEANMAGFGGGGPFLGLGDKKRFDLVELGKNPLGLNDKNYDKIDPKNVTKKVNKQLSKVFGW